MNLQSFSPRYSGMTNKEKLAFTCSKSTIKALEKGVKYVQCY